MKIILILLISLLISTASTEPAFETFKINNPYITFYDEGKFDFLINATKVMSVLEQKEYSSSDKEDKLMTRITFEGGGYLTTTVPVKLIEQALISSTKSHLEVVPPAECPPNN